MSDSNARGRKLFMHPAHETIGVSAGLAAFRSCDLSRFAGAEQAERPPRVRLVCASYDARSEEALAALEDYLTDVLEMSCMRAICPTTEALLSLEGLDETDSLVILARQITVVGGHIGRFVFDHHEELVACLHPAENDNAPNRADAEVAIVDTVGAHPVLAGVRPFRSRVSFDVRSNVADNATVLLMGRSADTTRPVAWVQRLGAARLLQTTLGDPADFHNPSFIHLLANAVYWTLGRIG